MRFALSLGIVLSLVSASVFAQGTAVVTNPASAQVISQPPNTSLSVSSLNNELNPMVCGTSAPPSWCSGNDLGAWLNAAFNLILSNGNGNRVVIPWQPEIHFTTTIRKPRGVRLDCEGTKLVYEGTSVAVVIGDANAYDNSTGGIDDCWLWYGPSGEWAPGMPVTTGFYLGGDPTGNISSANYNGSGQTFNNVRVQGFAWGWRRGANVYLDSWFGGFWAANNVGFQAENNGAGNSGENFSIFGTMINNNVTAGIWDDTGDKFSIHGGGIDYDGPNAIYGQNVNVDLEGVWMENFAAPLIVTTGTAPHHITIHGGKVVITNTSGADLAIYSITGNGSVFSDSDTEYYVAHYLNQFVHWDDPGINAALYFRNPQWDYYVGTAYPTQPWGGSPTNYLYESKGSVVSSGSSSTSAQQGPATAPAGSCSSNGIWVFSQDGHASVCLGGSWVLKL